MTWSIDELDLSCSIDSSGNITAGSTTGTITVRATDANVSGCDAAGRLVDGNDPTIIAGGGGHYRPCLVCGRGVGFWVP